VLSENYLKGDRFQPFAKDYDDDNQKLNSMYIPLSFIIQSYLQAFDPEHSPIL
jgi:hypothetical protein